MPKRSALDANSYAALTREDLFAKGFEDAG